MQASPMDTRAKASVASKVGGVVIDSRSARWYHCSKRAVQATTGSSRPPRHATAKRFSPTMILFTCRTTSSPMRQGSEAWHGALAYAGASPKRPVLGAWAVVGASVWRTVAPRRGLEQAYYGPRIPPCSQLTTHHSQLLFPKAHPSPKAHAARQMLHRSRRSIALIASSAVVRWPASTESSASAAR